ESRLSRARNSVSRLGLEPRTPALKGQCSTIELPARKQSFLPNLGLSLDIPRRACLPPAKACSRGPALQNRPASKREQNSRPARPITEQLILADFTTSCPSLSLPSFAPEGNPRRAGVLASGGDGQAPLV